MRATDRHIHDVLAVADACAVAQFTLWGFLYGGNIAELMPQLVAGASNAEIAAALVVSLATAQSTSAICSPSSRSPSRAQAIARVREALDLL